MNTLVGRYITLFPHKTRTKIKKKNSIKDDLITKKRYHSDNPEIKEKQEKNKFYTII